MQENTQAVFVKSSLVFRRPGVYIVNVQGESIIDGVSTVLLGDVKLWWVRFPKIKSELGRKKSNG